MSRLFHTLTAFLGSALVIVPVIEGVLPVGKLKAVVAGIGGVLLFVTDKMKVLGRAA